MKLLLNLSALWITLLSPFAYAEQKQLGRLFFTAEQRQQLDFGKSQDNTGAAPESLTLNGIVQKQGGGRTVWINGVPQNMGHSDEHNPTSMPVSIPSRAQTITVKVGQKISVTPDNSNTR